MFGEGLEEHLLATNRTIAFPIGKKYAFKIAIRLLIFLPFPIVLAVSFLRQTNLDDEGLFRISTKQIKLDKLKAYLDAGLEFIPLLQVLYVFYIIFFFVKNVFKSCDFK